MMISVAMLLDWLGTRDSKNSMVEAAAAFQMGIAGALADEAARTPDLGGKGTTSDFGKAVAERVK